MNFRPNPLLYGANKDFFSAFRLAIRMSETVDYELLSRAVRSAITRYPYFCVSPERDGEMLVLRYNAHPVPVFPDDRTITLGSDESNGHLVSFGCKENTIFIDASHYIADGMGVDPLMKSVLFQYVSARYGAEGLEAERIRMPESPICEQEHAYPFPDSAMNSEEHSILPIVPAEAYALDADAFDQEGLYAYHLHIPQKAMMSKASSSDGSPISFLTVMLYRAFHQLDHSIDRPIVAHVQHQYRAMLRAPMSHHSLVSYIPVSLAPRLNQWDVERQNTVVRGQVILKGGIEADIASVNRLIEAFSSKDTFAGKREAMAQYAEDSPVVSTIKNFREEYEAHIYEKRCPAGTCQKLKQIVIDPALCKGCTKCSRVCPVSAISGKVKEPHTIDLNKCIRCGSCIGACAFKAIKEG